MSFQLRVLGLGIFAAQSVGVTADSMPGGLVVFNVCDVAVRVLA